MTPDRWFTSITPLITFLLGVLISRHYYLRSDRKRIPTFVVQSQNLIAAGALGMVGLKVVHDGRQVGENGITEAHICFWNSGTLPVLQGQILEPYTISTPGPVLYSSVLKSSRAVVGLQLSVSADGSLTNELTLRFSVLEPGDGATLRLVYDGPANVKIGFKGACLAAPKPTILEPDPIYATTRPKRLPYMLGRIFTTFAPLLIVILVVKGGGWAIDRFFGAHVVEIAGNVLVVLIAALFLFTIGFVLWYQYKRLKAPYLPPDVKP